MVSPRGKPTIMCPAREYDYQILETPQRVICTATSRGFGQAVFAWQINGLNLGKSGVINPPVAVFEDDPSLPDGGKNNMVNDPINYSITSGFIPETMFTGGALTSTVSLEFPTTVGHFSLNVGVSAREKFASVNTDYQGKIVNIDTEVMKWDDSYYRDGEICRKNETGSLEQIIKIRHDLYILLTLLDPPPEYPSGFHTD